MNINYKYFLFCFLLASCSRKFFDKTFVFINTAKESDIQLTLKKDSTFLIVDKYGCQRLNQKGKWVQMRESNQTFKAIFILSDTSKYNSFTNQFNKIIYSYKSNVDEKIYSVRQEFLYPIITNDTIYLINNKSLLLRNDTFVIFNGNVEKLRLRRIEKKLISQIGRRNYIKTIGEGKGIKRARLNLKRCGNQS